MQSDSSTLVEHCFRHEYGRLVAVLTRALGVRNLELVEDVVQAALAKAIHAWALNGVPSDPSALLITKSNVEKRITRAKEKLREVGVEIADLNPHSMEGRLGAVQSTIYLLFNEGYLSSSGDVVLRKDLCDEAIRLVRMLIQHTRLAPASNAALLALMLMHAARFDARVDTRGAIVLLESQDRLRWDWILIREAMDWMTRSTETDQLSRFHIESAIAWEHCRATTFEAINWRRIVELYQVLERLYAGPMIRLNLAIAWSYVAGPEAGLQRLIDLPEIDRNRLRPWWDCAVAEAYHRLGKTAEAIAHWTDALSLTKIAAHRELIARKLANPKSVSEIGN